MLYKSAGDLSPGFITMQGHKYSYICNLCGKFLPVGMICTTTDTISTPVGEMYLHARMFCTLTHMSSIPMGAINFYMQECFSHSLIPLLFSCLRCIYMQECSVHSLRKSSISMGAISFYMQEHFFTLADTITPIFTVLTKVWPCANRTMVTNN